MAGIVARGRLRVRTGPRIILAAMLYALDKRELEELRELELVPRFDGAKMLSVVYRTDPELVRTILPAPLQPLAEPLAVAFVADYPTTNFGLSYHEAGLALACRLGKQVGLYHLCMPVDDDTAMIGGRESFGFPKKMAEAIELERDGDHVEARVRRHGVELMHLRAKLGDEAPAAALDRLFPREDEQRVLRSFLIKFFPSPDGKSLDYLPRVVRQETSVTAAEPPRSAEVELELRSSAADPLAEIPVRELVTAVYGSYDLILQPGRVVRRIWNVLRFLPHLFFKTDTLALLRRASK
jgi:acetoacetate decarboxylase